MASLKNAYSMIPIMKFVNKTLGSVKYREVITRKCCAEKCSYTILQKSSKADVGLELLILALYTPTKTYIFFLKSNFS